MTRTACLLLTTLFATSSARASSLEGFPTRRIDFEFKDVSVGDLFGLVADAAGVAVKVDPCAASRKLTLKMRNAPLDVVVQAVADREQLSYRFDGKQLTVACGEPAVAAPSDPAGVASAPPAAPSGDRAELVRLRAENASLRAQLSKITGVLRTQRNDLEASQGSPIAPPPNLPPRFGSDALLKAVTQALREAGLSATQVTSIDCSEYPCIVYGDGMNTFADGDKLKSAPSWTAYAQDRMASFSWKRAAPYPPGASADPADPGMHWGLTVTPSDDPTSPDEMMKRLNYRLSLMRDASQDGPPEK